MSDDELPPTGGMDMDGLDDDFDDEPGAGDGLPEGIKKEVITDAGGWKTPKVGDEVTVHYVGTLESDGSEFDSSRGRGQPLVFELGKGRVIKGWDLGVATMKKGEIAKFTIAPEYAYGESGHPPKIPANATLIFEVELISWVSKDDLFGDEGVIKSEVTEGTGWKNPKKGDEVLLSLKAEKPDGTAVEERTDFDYVLGSEALGALGKACDKALTGMKRAEEVSLKCSTEYIDAARFPEGGVVKLTLKEIYETKDVSFMKDQTVMKKQIKQGEGYDLPKDGAKCTLCVEAATDGSTALPGFAAKDLDFTAGDGEVCDALEAAVAEMKKGEKAVVTVSKCALAAEAKLGLQGVKADKVVLTAELKDFEKAKDTYSMSEDEKVEFGTARKDKGGELFKAGRYAMALQRYKKVGDLFNYIDNFQDENKAKAKALKTVCELNKAACYLKLEDHVEAKKACDTVLKDESQNVKAVYRRAQAQYGLKNFLECVADCKRVVELDPKNKEARALLKQAQAGQKEEDKKAKGLFASMCKALGKGPIPEPYKAKAEGEMEDFDDSEEEEPLPPAPPAEDAKVGEAEAAPAAAEAEVAPAAAS